MSRGHPGTIVTFYSYKGGTGRSMAVANIGCLLALEGNKTLIIDWDLEAPGQHRYFPETDKHDRPGLLDLFEQISRDHQERLDSSTDYTREGCSQIVPDLGRFICETGHERLGLMRAGVFDDSYAGRVSAFDWERLFSECPEVFHDLSTQLASAFDYVLIDSRTGYTDTSGICTMLMPEKLVAVFTPNEQSLTGVINLTRQASEYRRTSDDYRPLSVFPLPSRIDYYAEKARRETWRQRYQSEFENVFSKAYAIESLSLGAYFDAVQLPHVPYYSYGEEIAVLTERSEVSSLRRQYETLLTYLKADSCLDKVESVQPASPQMTASARGFGDLSRKARLLLVAVVATASLLGILLGLTGSQTTWLPGAKDRITQTAVANETLMAHRVGTASAQTATSEAALSAGKTATWSAELTATPPIATSSATASATGTPSSTTQATSTADVVLVPSATANRSSTPSVTQDVTPSSQLSSTPSPTSTPSVSMVLVRIEGLPYDKLACLSLWLQDTAGTVTAKIPMSGTAGIVAVPIGQADTLSLIGSEDGTCPWWEYTLHNQPAENIELVPDTTIEFVFAKDIAKPTCVPPD